MDNQEQTFNGLFNGLCEAMLSKLQDPEITAGDMNVIRQFLKDNNISAVAARGSPLANVVEAFPFQDENDDNGGQHFNNKIAK